MIIRLEPRPKRTWIFTENSWEALNMQCPMIISLLTNNAFYLRRLQNIDFENLKFALLLFWYIYTKKGEKYLN